MLGGVGSLILGGRISRMALTGLQPKVLRCFAVAQHILPSPR